MLASGKVRRSTSHPSFNLYAGVGLAPVMILALIFHITRSEFGNRVINAVLLALAAFVAYGRWPHA